jgi:hypothetical protein
MHTTLVRWNSAPGTEAIAAIELKLQELLGDDWETYNRLFRFVTNDAGQQVSARDWPSLATAEAWIEFVNSLAEPPASATISSQ